MSATAVASPGPAQNRVTGLRLIPSIETYPRVLHFAQTAVGKLTLWALFVLCLFYFFRSPAELVPLALGLLALSFFPAQRWPIVAVCTIVITAIDSRSPNFLVVLALGVLLFYCARRWPRSEFAQRPIAFILIGCSLLVIAASTVPRTASYFVPMWQAVGLATSYVWFIGYALTDRAANVKKDLPLEVGSFHPFWGSTTTPLPKGAAYLRRIEARDAEQLAVAQIKGLKLLFWAILTTLFTRIFVDSFREYLHIPLAAQALAKSVQGAPYPWYVCWESQVLSFFGFVLHIAAQGHRIIACCRFAGFNALRNTYRPFSSRTVSEFFNRFYFYFKELLVDFFFYPTFMRYFKKHPRLRLAAATFAAAAFGNMVFHFLRNYEMIPRFGLLNALVNFKVFAFYSIALATGLTVSQLRKQGTPYPGFLRGRLLPQAGVLFFYCVLDVFGSAEGNYPLVEHFRYLGHMFGINL